MLNAFQLFLARMYMLPDGLGDISYLASYLYLSACRNAYDWNRESVWSISQWDLEQKQKLLTIKTAWAKWLGKTG